MVGEVWLKAARAELNLELTRRAIEVRERLRSGDVGPSKPSRASTVDVGVIGPVRQPHEGRELRQPPR